MGVPAIQIWEGVPLIQTWEGGAPPLFRPRMGVPLVQVKSQDGGGGVPPSGQSIACTCCAVGGMPLAFTQDFLVCQDV